MKANKFLSATAAVVLGGTLLAPAAVLGWQAVNPKEAKIQTTVKAQAPQKTAEPQKAASKQTLPENMLAREGIPAPSPDPVPAKSVVKETIVKHPAPARVRTGERVKVYHAPATSIFGFELEPEKIIATFDSGEKHIYKYRQVRHGTSRCAELYSFERRSADPTLAPFYTGPLEHAPIKEFLGHRHGKKVVMHKPTLHFEAPHVVRHVHVSETPVAEKTVVNNYYINKTEYPVIYPREEQKPIVVQQEAQPVIIVKQQQPRVIVQQAEPQEPIIIRQQAPEPVVYQEPVVHYTKPVRPHYHHHHHCKPLSCLSLSEKADYLLNGRRPSCHHHHHHHHWRHRPTHYTLQPRMFSVQTSYSDPVYTVSPRVTYIQPTQYVQPQVTYVDNVRYVQPKIRYVRPTVRYVHPHVTYVNHRYVAPVRPHISYRYTVRPEHPREVAVYNGRFGHSVHYRYNKPRRYPRVVERHHRDAHWQQQHTWHMHTR